MTPSDLKTWRRKVGLYQSDLATLLGVSTMAVSRWERGTRAIPPYLELALHTLEQLIRERQRAAGIIKDSSAALPSIVT